MPLKGLYLLLFFLMPDALGKSFILVLDPAGDAKNTGRAIGDYFERGITSSCAAYIKQRLEQLNTQIRVILTRTPGESVEPFQNANFANRFSTDLYVSLHFFYQSSELKPTIYLYYFLSDPQLDFLNKQVNPLTLLSVCDAYLFSLPSSRKAIDAFNQLLQQQQYRLIVDVKGVFGIPFKPLMGIIKPAFGIEIGIKSYDDWKICVEPLIECLITLIERQLHD